LAYDSNRGVKALKKLFFLINIFAAGFCFGQITGAYEAAGGYSAYAIEAEEEYTSNTGYTFGWAGVTNVGAHKTGAGTYINFTYLSQTASHDTATGHIIKNGGGNFLCSIDFLAGPVFMLYDSEKIKVPLAIGFHGNIFLTFLRGWISAEDLGLGGLAPGAEIEYEIDYGETNCGAGFSLTAEYCFSKEVYFLGRIQGSFDFINFFSGKARLPTPAGKIVIADEKGIRFSRAWGLMPQVGIGIRF
jgi:hypothetical protein